MWNRVDSQHWFVAAGSTHLLSRGCPLRCGAEAEQSDAASTDAIVAADLDGDGGAGDGEVAVAAGELLDGEAAAAGPHGNGHADEQLVGVHRRGPESVEELGRGDAPRAAHGNDLEAAVAERD